jgi:hypothetical protein
VSGKDQFLEFFSTRPDAVAAIPDYLAPLRDHGLSQAFEVYPDTVNVSEGGQRVSRGWGLFVGPRDRHNPPNMVTLSRKRHGVTPVSRLVATSG